MIDLDSKNNDASCALHFLRAAAAQAVCVGHALSFFSIAPLLPPNRAYMQNLAVCAFFLLSGLLIADTLVRRSRDPGYGFGHYALERIARIHSGLIPALVLIAIVDGALLWAGMYDFPAYLTPRAFLGNLFLLQGYRGLGGGWLHFPNFGSGGPLWTLAIEFHIYLFVGAVFFILRGSRWWPLLVLVALFFAQLPLIFLFGTYEPGLGTGLFALWLAGFALVFVVGSPSFRVPLPVCIGAALISAYWLRRSIIPGHEYDVTAYPLMVAAFAAFLAAALRTRRTTGTGFAKVVRLLADYSLTLYLIHYTLLYALTKLWPNGGWGGVVIGVAVANLIAAVLAHWTEKRHKAVARGLAALLEGRLPFATKCLSAPPPDQAAPQAR